MAKSTNLRSYLGKGVKSAVNNLKIAAPPVSKRNIAERYVDAMTHTTALKSISANSSDNLAYPLCTLSLCPSSAVNMIVEIVQVLLDFNLQNSNANLEFIKSALHKEESGCLRAILQGMGKSCVVASVVHITHEDAINLSSVVFERLLNATNRTKLSLYDYTSACLILAFRDPSYSTDNATRKVLANLANGNYTEYAVGSFIELISRLDGQYLNDVLQGKHMMCIGLSPWEIMQGDVFKATKSDAIFTEESICQSLDYLRPIIKEIKQDDLDPKEAALTFVAAVIGLQHVLDPALFLFFEPLSTLYLYTNKTNDQTLMRLDSQRPLGYIMQEFDKRIKENKGKSIAAFGKKSRVWKKIKPFKGMMYDVLTITHVSDIVSGGLKLSIRDFYLHESHLDNTLFNIYRDMNTYVLGASKDYKDYTFYLNILINFFAEKTSQESKD